MYASKRLMFGILFLIVFSLLSTQFTVHAEVDAKNTRRALADINRDGKVNVDDLNRLQNAYGITNPVKRKALSDVNQDSVVDILDASFVGARIGKKISVCELADIDRSKTVDQSDLDFIGSYYGQDATSTNMPADLTGDGSIDILDLSKAGAVYGCNW